MSSLIDTDRFKTRVRALCLRRWRDCSIECVEPPPYDELLAECRSLALGELAREAQTEGERPTVADYRATRRAGRERVSNPSPRTRGGVLHLLSECEEHGFEPTYAQLLAEVRYMESQGVACDEVSERMLQSVRRLKNGQPPPARIPQIRIVYSRD